MAPLSNFVETFVKFARISSPGKAGGVSEGPRREKNSDNSQNTSILPNFEVLDMDSIMLVIGLVKMLNFSKENGDLGGLNLIFLRPQSVTVPYDVLPSPRR